jgi:molecular chaperone DnaK (HSP70)
LTFNADFNRTGEFACNVDFQTTISRKEFDNCCMDLFEATTKVLDVVLQSRKQSHPKSSGSPTEMVEMAKGQIDEIVLVGGSTRIPKIQEILSRHFNGKSLINQSIRTRPPLSEPQFWLLTCPELLVRRQGMKNFCWMPYPCQFEWTCMLRKDQHRPVEKSEMFSTDTDNQTSATFSFFEGEKPLLKNNLFLSEVTLDGIGPTPKCVPMIIVTVVVYVSYTMKFSVMDKATNRCVEKIVGRSIDPLFEKDLKIMRTEATQMRKEDKIDAQRAILLNTPESEGYLLEDEFNGLKLTQEIRSYLEEQVKSFYRKAANLA